MSEIRLERRVSQELPSISLDWLEGDDGTLAALATGWTGSVKVVAASAPNTLLHTMTGVTLASTSPNFVITASTSDWQSIVTASGVALPTYGAPFYLSPHLVRNADSTDRVWPGPRITVWLRPAIT